MNKLSKKLTIALCISLGLNAVAAGVAGVKYLPQIMNKYSGGGVYSFADNPQYSAKVSLFNQSEVVKADRVMLGDSLTAGCAWQEYEPDKVVLNRGVGSDISEGVLNRLDSVTKHRPDEVMLMIGINDLVKGIAREEIVENVTQILTALKEKLPQADIFLQSVLPTNGENVAAEEIIALNNAYRYAASQTGAHYIDLYPLFATENDAMIPELTYDGVHLNGEGYVIWLQALEDSSGR